MGDELIAVRDVAAEHGRRKSGALAGGFHPPYKKGTTHENDRFA
jgi:hypothetical protein